MPTWTNQRPSDPFMTVALLIALAGSLAAMAVIVGAWSNDEQVLEIDLRAGQGPTRMQAPFLPEMCVTVR